MAEDSGRDRRSRPDVDSMYTLKVDNISFKTSSGDLRSMFGEIGDIYIPQDFHTHEPRGFAFVRFIEKADADEALKELDGRTLDGREMRIQFAQKKRPDDPKSFYSGRRGDRYRDRDRNRSRSRGRRDARSRSRDRGRDRDDRRDRDYDRPVYDDRRGGDRYNRRDDGDRHDRRDDGDRHDRTDRRDDADRNGRDDADRVDRRDDADRTDRKEDAEDKYHRREKGGDDRDGDGYEGRDRESPRGSPRRRR